MWKAIRFSASFLAFAFRPTARSIDLFDWVDLIRAFGAFSRLGMLGWLGRLLDTFTLPLAGVVFLFFLAGVRLRFHIESYRQRPKPHLEFCELRLAGGITGATTTPIPDRTALRDVKGYRELRQDLQVLYATVRNNPQNRSPSAEAQKAVVEISYCRMEKNEPFLTIQGRWFDNPQVANYAKHESIAHLRQRDLAPNGDLHGIEIAMKYTADTQWYATNDWAFRQIPDGKYPEYQLPNEPLKVRIVVRAVGMDEDATKRFVVERGEVGEEMVGEGLSIR